MRDARRTSTISRHIDRVTRYQYFIIITAFGVCFASRADQPHTDTARRTSDKELIVGRNTTTELGNSAAAAARRIR